MKFLRWLIRRFHRRPRRLLWSFQTITIRSRGGDLRLARVWLIPAGRVIHVAELSTGRPYISTN